MMNNAWCLCWILITINHYLFKCKENRCSYPMIKIKSRSRASQQLHIKHPMTNTYTKYFINIWLSEEGIRWQSQSLAFGVRFWRGLAPTRHRLTLAMKKARICLDCRAKRTLFCSGGNCAGVSRDRCFVPRRDGTRSSLSVCVCLYVRVCEHLLPLAWCFKINSAGCEDLPVPLCVVYTARFHLWSRLDILISRRFLQLINLRFHCGEVCIFGYNLFNECISICGSEQFCD